MHVELNHPWRVLFKCFAIWMMIHSLKKWLNIIKNKTFFCATLRRYLDGCIQYIHKYSEWMTGHTCILIVCTCVLVESRLKTLYARFAVKGKDHLLKKSLWLLLYVAAKISLTVDDGTHTGGERKRYFPQTTIFFIY